MFIKFCSTEGDMIVDTDDISYVIDIKMHAKDSGTRTVYLKNGKMFKVSNELQDIHGALINAIKTNNNSR